MTVLIMVSLWAALPLVGHGQGIRLEAGQEAYVDSLLGAMTLQERIGQLTLFTSDLDVTGPTLRAGYLDDVRAGRVGALFNAFTPGYTREIQRLAVEETRLGIPLLFGYDVIHGFRTIFPIPLAEAASWDTTLVERAAQVAATESAAAGLHWTYAPMVDIARDPRWGRVMEGSGEDVTLGSAMARARVRGFQGDDLAADSTVLACVKHFAAYGAAEAGRDYNTVDMSDRVLRETYLPPFKAAIDAGAATVMTSFNEVDGVPASGSHYLLTDILREEWGFDGFVVTDYTSINEMVQHGVVEDLAGAAALAVEAGVDMDMQGAAFYEHLDSLVGAGAVSEARVTEAARRILRTKAALGLFDDPYRYCDSVAFRERVFSVGHRAEARRTAAASMVLLKHTGGVLPLARDARIALVGPLGADQDAMLGAWRGNGQAEEAVSPVMGLTGQRPAGWTTAAGAGAGADTTAAAPFADVRYVAGTSIAGGETDDFVSALGIAEGADVIVACVGESAAMSGEAASRSSLDLPGSQLALLRALAATGKPLVTVVFAGRPLALAAVDSLSDAVLYAWFPGSAAGDALADVLSGAVDPSGRLPMTFPRSVGQVPLYYDAKNTGRPLDANNKYTSKYLDVPNTPLYAFGHGLGYSTVRYGAPGVSAATLGARDSVTLTVEVTNTGERAQRETVQVYYRDPVAQRTRPVLQLLAWRQIDLAPGETQAVTVPVRARDLTYLGPDGRTPTLDAGAIELFVGPASDRLQAVEIVVQPTP